MKVLDAAISSSEKAILKQELEAQHGIIYQNTSMLLDVICSNLYYNHKIDAEFSGRTIWIGKQKVATVEVSKEGRNMVTLYKYRFL